MKRLAYILIALCACAVPLRAQEGVRLPVQSDGFLLIGVSTELLGEITSAQDAKGATFTIAIDGAAEEPLAVSPERLRDYQNVYFRVVGDAGARRLEENGFSATGADAESRLIRRFLGVPDSQQVFFLPGRQHLLVPAQSRVVLRAGERKWTFQATATLGGPRLPTRAVVVRAGQPVSLTLTDAVAAEQLRRGTRLSLTVAQPVEVDGLVAIAAGATVDAEVVESKAPGFFGRPGRLVLALDSVFAVDGSAVPLRGRSGAQLAFEGRPGVFRGQPVRLAAGSLLNTQAGANVVVLAPVDTP